MLMRKVQSKGSSAFEGQRGSAMAISLFVLALVGIFVALAVTRSASEAVAVGNEAGEGRATFAAQGSLEMMTRNFNKIFEIKLNASEADITAVETAPVPFLDTAVGGNYTFDQKVDQICDSRSIVLPGGPYAGLYATRDCWQLKSTSTDRTGIQVELTRNILNNRIPIFQFGVFYEDDLELFRPPRFGFGGRVHTNRHFFISPGADGVYFDSRVTAVGHVVTQSWRNGFSGDSGNTQTFIKNASGVNRQLLPTMGSVLNGTPNVFGSGDWANPDMPSSALNPNFTTQTAIFDGNLQAGVKPLKLPLKVGNANADLIEMLRRPKNVATGGISGDLAWDGADVVPVTLRTEPNTTATEDNDIQKSERFANKTGIRVTLADSKAKLPGCASGVGTAAVGTPCGIRLDGDTVGQGANPNTAHATLALRSRGYLPLPMTDGYQATRLNGERLFMGRESWIKVETVSIDGTNGAIITQDITQDILSLGVTEEAPSTIAISGYSGTRAADNNGTATSPSSNLTATTARTPLTFPDSRSVIKLQRFSVGGASIPRTPSGSPGFGPFMSHVTSSGGYNYVRRFTAATAARILTGCASCTADDMVPLSSAGAVNERYGHLKLSGTEAVVPFPIQMFDSREGEYYDDADRYTAGRVTRNGVMSMIDIDVANLRRFLRGDYNAVMPTTTPIAVLKGGVGLVTSFTGVSDIPQKEGWVLYVSDRRGDQDFDGEYDMEDVYSNSPGNSGGLDGGEDANRNGALDTKYLSSTEGSLSCTGFAALCEATRYSEEWYPDYAAATDHKYFRRGVRLINGTTIPGIYDSGTPSNTRGFTVSSENGVYVKGNYNATHVTSIPAIGNTPAANYRPINDAVHIPASIVADAVTILSNNWTDSESFAASYDKGTLRQATDTTIRFAMISGDTIATKEATPNQGGISPRLNGGVHNFKRFLERWTGDNLSYSGSLINLYNSRNNAGSFKCCNTVYDPPVRNWVFDSTFLDPTRLPPGTPYFQYTQTTGFQRTNF